MSSSPTQTVGYAVVDGLEKTTHDKLEHFTRDTINAKIESLGAKVGSAVSPKTDYLVCGDKAGSKLTKAQSLGISILSETEFLNMVGVA